MNICIEPVRSTYVSNIDYVARRGHPTLEAAVGRNSEILDGGAPSEYKAKPTTRRLRLPQHMRTELRLVTEELIVAIFEHHQSAAAQAYSEASSPNVLLPTTAEVVLWREAQRQIHWCGTFSVEEHL